MKKFFIGVGIVVIGIAAVAYLYLGSTKLAIDTILPTQPLVYVKASDIEKRLSDFQKTKLWRTVSKIDVARLLEKSGAPDKEIIGYEKFAKGFTGSLSNPLLAQIFGQEVALAVYPGAGVKSPQEAVTGVIFVTRLKPEAKFIDFVSSLYAKMDKKVVKSQEKYKNFDVTTLELEKGFAIVYVQIKDLLVIAFDKEKINAVIDVATHASSALSQDADFRATMEQCLKPAHTLVYVDMQLCAKAFMSSVDELMSKAGTSMQNQETRSARQDASRAFSRLAGFRTLGISMAKGDIEKSKFVVLFDKTKLEPILAKTYSVKAVKNNTARFIPKDSLWYQWGCFDPKVVWESFITDMPQAQTRPGPTPVEIVKGIEGSLGIDIEKDVIGSLGNEAGNALTNIDLNGPFPVPGLMLFVKVNNKGNFEKMIDSALEKNNFPTSVEEYKSKSIKYAVLPFGENLQPGFCFLDDYLLIATSHKVLKECIDAWSNQAAALPSDKEFQSVNFGLTDKANGACFIRVATLLDRLKGVGDWFVGLMTLVSSGEHAYKKAGEQNIQELKNAISTQEIAMKDLESKETALKQELARSTVQVDSIAKQAALDSLEKEIKSGQLALDDKKDELVKISSAAPAVAKKEMDPKLLKLYMDELVYPILEGLKSIKAVGAVGAFKDTCAESVSYIKVSN